MKTKLLLILFVIGIFSLDAQTTHNLNWFSGIGPNVDLTIEPGDTVIWTWTSPNHSVENDPAGSSLESFDSGIIFPTGTMFSHTFTVVGSNEFCQYAALAYGNGRALSFQPHPEFNDHFVSDLLDARGGTIPAGNQEYARTSIGKPLANDTIAATLVKFLTRQ